MHAQTNKDSLVIATLKIDQTENVLHFNPTVENKSEYHYELDYLLLIKKTDGNKNLSVNQQKGKFTLSPNELKKLSSTTINQTENQKIKAILFIRNEDENKLIAKDSVEIITKDLIPVNENSLQTTTGIVIDDSKTKLGRDYYDIFFATYTQYPNKFDFVINISELPYRGLSSIIQIKVDQELINEFFTNPDEDWQYKQLNAQIFIYNITANTHTNVSENSFKPMGVIDIDPIFSPNSSEIIFTSTSNDMISTRNIYSIDLNKEETRTLIIPNAEMADYQ